MPSCTRRPPWPPLRLRSRRPISRRFFHLSARLFHLSARPLGAATTEPHGKVKNAVRCPRPKNGRRNGIVIARSALLPISAKRIAPGWFVTRRHRNFARIAGWRNAPHEIGATLFYFTPLPFREGAGG